MILHCSSGATQDWSTCCMNCSRLAATAGENAERTTLQFQQRSPTLRSPAPLKRRRTTGRPCRACYSSPILLIFSRSGAQCAQNSTDSPASTCVVQELLEAIEAIAPCEVLAPRCFRRGQYGCDVAREQARSIEISQRYYVAYRNSLKYGTYLTSLG